MLAKARDIVRTIWISSKMFGVNPIKTAGRYAMLVTARRFSHSEIMSMALLDPAISNEALGRYCSKEEVWPIYEMLNPPKSRLILDDKVKFSERCAEHKLPTVPILAKIDKMWIEKEIALALAGSEGAKRSEVLQQLIDLLPQTFIAKPSFGFQGKGVLFFRKWQSRIFLWSGEELSDVAFLNLMGELLGVQHVSIQSEFTTQYVLFQERLLAHPTLFQITGRDTTQSLRVCTLLRKSGEPVILFVFLKLLAGTNLIDNFQKGKTGNLLAHVDRFSGSVVRVIGTDKVFGLKRGVSAHIDTNQALLGLKVPYWDAACDLALSAAKAFHGSRAVGWDIALTPDGPLLLEGNGTWDPLAPMYQRPSID